jgi:hypothetical protein
MEQSCFLFMESCRPYTDVFIAGYYTHFEAYARVVLIIYLYVPLTYERHNRKLKKIPEIFYDTVQPLALQIIHHNQHTEN